MMVMPVLVVLHFRFLKVNIDPCNSSLTGCPLGMNLLESIVRRTKSGILDLSSCGMFHKMKRHADFGTHLFQTNRTWNRPISQVVVAHGRGPLKTPNDCTVLLSRFDQHFSQHYAQFQNLRSRHSPLFWTNLGASRTTRTSAS